MAMLFMDGFDLADTGLKGYSAAPGTSTTTRFGTGRSATTAGYTLTKAITASSQIFCGFAFMQSQYDTGNVTSNAYITILSDSRTTSHLTVLATPTSVQLRLGALGGTIIASGPYLFFANQFNYLEVSATIADAGGTCVVKVNGSTVINFTGDTKNAGTNTTIDGISFGNGWNGITAYFDDLYICDSTGSAPYNTFLGEMRIYSLSPTAAGSSTQWTPDTGINYTRVNEVPYSAANYVQSGTVGQRDTYAMADLPATAGNILAVQNNVIAKRTDASAISVKPAILSGASVYYGSATSLTLNDATITDLRTADPNTAVSWTASGVNALEGGFEVA